jgi:hypothetical protein
MMDSYALLDSGEKRFVDCNAEMQGISPGFVGRIGYELPGQEIEITSLESGIYYLIITTNPDRIFKESDYENNTAWISFRISGVQRGNRTIEEIANSPCTHINGLCGEMMRTKMAIEDGSIVPGGTVPPPPALTDDDIKELEYEL